MGYGKNAALSNKKLREAVINIEAFKSDKILKVEHENRSSGNGRQIIRWNLVFNLLIWSIVPIPLWLPFVSPMVGSYAVPSINLCFSLFWVLVASLAIKNLVILYSFRNFDYDLDQAKGKSELPYHMVVISCYKEPLELIRATLDTLAHQTLAKSIYLVVSFEERTPEFKDKELALYKLYESAFSGVLITNHPYGLEGEIPGKCSNANFGIRKGLEWVMERNAAGFNLDNLIITTCDADSKFHPKFIEALTYKYINMNADDVKNCVFQAPLLYNWNLDAASMVTRVTGLIRAFLMLGALIPLNINTMSIFSFSASLCVQGNYVHPGYQMDDIIALIRWMGVCKKTIRIILVPVPLISGPTSGRVVEEEISEWGRQARRWTIGAAEVFHYFMVKSRGIPFKTSLSWGMTFITYYGVMLCCSSLYGFVSLLASIPELVKEDSLGPTFFLSVSFVFFQYLLFLLIFLLDSLTLKLTEPEVKERICLFRNLIHLLMAPFILLGYSLVEFYALHEVMIKGKEVCKHGASKKESLQLQH